MALTLTDGNFQTEVLESDKPVMVDFWASWCGPCLAIAPAIEELSKEFDGQAVIGKVNVDENQETPMKYGIRNIPTLLFFKNGEMVEKLVGANPKHVMEAKIKELVGE